MPPRANRKVCAILISALFATSLVIFSTRAQHHGEHSLRMPGTFSSPFTALFSFRAPSAFFTPTATISLTDDNSTYFAARPAAFGPILPNKGLSGQLWIGSGFSESVDEDSLDTSNEGELGCEDAPGWIHREWHRPVASRPVGELVSEPSTSGRDRAGISGKVALLSRGGCSFSEKVKWAQRRGATAVIVGDNIIGGPLVRMFAKGDASNISIPSLFTSHTTAHLLSSLVPLDTHHHKDAQFSKGQSHEVSRLHSSPVAGLIAKTYDTSSRGEFESSASHKRHKSIAMWSRELAWRLGYRRSSSTYTDAPGRLGSFESDGHGSKRAVVDESTADETLSLKVDQTVRHFLWRHGSEKRGVRTPVSSQLQRRPSSPSSPFHHQGLWVTLTPTNMSTSPFLNTLFVLVVSPLITLAIVYTMLLLRSRIRRRRWRAPKSIVERLPVRTYHTVSTPNSNSSSTVMQPTAATPIQTQATPLLADAEPSASSTSASRYGSCESGPHDTEKPDTGLEAWRKRYGGRQVECVVCLEEYEDGVSKVMSLPCGHEFHVDCITPWLTTRRRTCPICKGDVVRSLIHDDAATGASTDEVDGLTYDDVQTQAAETVNNSPSAAMPVPHISASFIDNAHDLERGGHNHAAGGGSSWYSSIQRHLDSYFSTPPQPPQPSTASGSSQPLSRPDDNA